MARSFNGTSDLIDTTLQLQNICNGPNVSSLTSFAISAWVNLTAGAGSFPMIATPASGGSGVFFGINIGNFSGLNLYTSALQSKNVATFTTGVWHHVACQYISNGSNTGTITIYDNGTDVTAGNQGTISIILNDAHHMHIADGLPGGNSYWKGSIADVAFWTAATQVAALSVAEIVALSNGARPYTVRPGNLAAYYPLDGLASPEPDLSGLARNGTLTGTALAAGPPVMMFTPRTPQFIPAAAGGGSAIKFRKTLSQIGGRVGTRQPIGWGI